MMLDEDDWKGEHLIRSVPKADPRTASRAAQLAGKAAGTICKHADCDHKLDRRNMTGFCRNHRQFGRSYGEARRGPRV